MESPALLVVDAANVVGARPDGWWHDRAGATRRLRDELAAVVDTGLPGLTPPVELVLVVEGQARDVSPTDAVRVVHATGSGDDAIVALLRGEPAGQRRIIVVTADRQLRHRVRALGAEVRGPRWVRPDVRNGTGTPESASRDVGPGTG